MIAPLRVEAIKSAGLNQPHQAQVNPETHEAVNDDQAVRLSQQIEEVQSKDDG